MKKNQIRGIAVLGIVAVVFLLVSLLIPFTKNAVFWIALLFGLISIAAQGYIMKCAFEDGGSTKSKFYGFPIARIGIIYLAVQLIASILFMDLAKIAPVWLEVLLFVVFLAAAAIGFIAADSVREEIEAQDRQLKKDVSMMQDLISKSRYLVGLCETAEMTQAVQKLADSFRYSDPVSSPALAELEADLSNSLDELQKAIVDGDTDGTLTMCRQIENALAERNRVCKLGKKGR